MRRIWIVVAILLIFTLPALAQEDKPKILVNTFENPSNASQSTIGNALTDIFVTELSKGGRFRIIDPSLAPTRPADLLILAKVTNFSYQENELKGQRVDVPEGQARAGRVYEQLINVRIDFRIVDAATQEVVLADSGERRERNVSAEARMADYNRLVAAGVSISTQELMGSLMGRASVEAVSKLVERINDYFDIVGFELARIEGKVLGVINPQNFVVNLGSSAGLRSGDVLNVYREVPIRDDRGRTIYVEKQIIGTLEVVDCQSEGARVRLASGSGIRRDDLVIREPKIDANERVSRGQRLLEKRFYAAALKEFNEAKQLSPNSPDVWEGIGRASLFLKKWQDASSAWQQVIAAGGNITLPVYHRHAWRGLCFGTLIVGRDFLEFKPPAGEDSDHGFRLTFDNLIRLEVYTSTNSLGVRALDAKKKEKNWDFQYLLPVFLRPEVGGYINYEGDDAEINRQVLTFIRSYVQRRPN